LTLAAFKIDAEKLLGVPVSVLTPNALPSKFRGRVVAAGAASVKHQQGGRVHCWRLSFTPEFPPA